jgi:glycosyltransferase involved in cell wall biosynthesis
LWKHIICQRINRIVSVSQFIKNSIDAFGRINPNDCVIYSCPPRRITTKEEKNQYIETNCFRVGYIGRLSKEKGVDIFLKAAINVIKERTDVIFYIAGSFDYDIEFTKELQSFFAKNIDKGQIIFLNEVENIKLFFPNINILCIPSIYEEPLANTLIEAKQYKIPSIIFNSGGLPELITHKYDGFICFNSTVDSLVEGIYYYLLNPHLIYEHGINAYKSIVKLGIDYDSYKKKWLNVFCNGNS